MAYIFFTACESTVPMKFVLQNGADVYSLTLCEKMYPFEISIIKKRYECTRLLISHGFKYKDSTITKNKERLITSCIISHDITGVELCLQAGEFTFRVKRNISRFRLIAQISFFCQLLRPWIGMVEFIWPVWRFALCLTLTRVQTTLKRCVNELCTEK